MAEHQGLLSLVPVGLREAVIDSPPFRASVRHFEDQVELLEKWLESYIKTLSDWLAGLQRLEEQTAVLCARAAPSFLAEGLVDPDYTFLAMNRFSEGIKSVWGKIFQQGRDMRDVMINPMSKFMREDIKEFRNQRKEFYKVQDRFEELVARNASQPKSKDPNLLREDAVQLYTARMNYIQASASYSITISNFRTSCDRFLVSSFAGFGQREIGIAAELAKGFSGLGKEVRKILAWNTEMSRSAKALQDQLYITKSKLEKEMADRVAPKRELNAYTVWTLPAPLNKGGMGSRVGRGSVDSDTSSANRNYSVSSTGKPGKQGWLFHRVTTGKPSRWVRRWFFVKDGSFGWLQNSAKTAAVEESERVGVLLCHVRLAAAEDRRFCFEVMTKATSYMLQAETEGDLADWIQVFELAKNAVLADDKTPHPQAFSIMAPGHAEFAISPTEEHSERQPSIAQSTSLAAPQPTVARASFDTAPSTGGGGSLQASQKIVQKLESRLKDRPKGRTNPAGGIGSLVAASHNTITAQHAPLQHIQISAPRPLDIFTDPVAGSNMAPATLAHPPLSTQMSTRAIQARSRSTSSVSNNAPSGVMANYWGSMHWGLVSVDDANRVPTIGPDSTNQAQGSADTCYEKAQAKAASAPKTPTTPASPTEKRARRTSLGTPKRGPSDSTSSVEIGPIQYPAHYPVELRKQDAQFRTLFPAAHSDEFVLLVCRVMWQPVEGQQLWGRMYGTNFGLHFFAHAQGMVCVQTVPFSDIIKISHHVGISSDNIVIERDHLDPIDAKVYLDSANLVTRRIDVLFRNSLSDQPTDASELLQQIKQMEEERESEEETVQSRKSEEFDVIRAPTEGLIVEEASSLPPTLLRRFGDKLHLAFPTEPVLCNCRHHLDRVFAEYIFQIPAKSLFHLMFGDSTPVWKKVYRGRRVGDLEIGPWKTANKQLIREYKYVIEFNDAFTRKRRETHVTEYQTILKREEYLCYVVEVRFRPWDLPRNESIALLHKYCITYESKTKCKLLVSVGVDLIRVPRFVRALVRRTVNLYNEDAARRVTSEVEAQVTILGRNTDPQRAVKMYGRIGDVFDPQITKTGWMADDTGTLSERSMVSLFMEDMVGSTERMVEDVLHLPSDSIRRTIHFIDLHKILLLILLLSAIINLLLSGRSTLGYWQQRQADKFMRRVGVTENKSIIRMVSLKDIDELVSRGLSGVNASTPGLCYMKFTELYALNDLADSNYDDSPEYTTPIHRQKALELRSRRQQINAMRHELLVSLRSVNAIERELVEGEWMTWLGEELFRCDSAAQILTEIPREELEARMDDLVKFKEYCWDCNVVWEKVKGRFSTLS